MKKVLFMLIITVILAGCTIPQSRLNIDKDTKKPKDEHPAFAILVYDAELYTSADIQIYDIHKIRHTYLHAYKYKSSSPKIKIQAMYLPAKTYSSGRIDFGGDLRGHLKQEHYFRTLPDKNNYIGTFFIKRRSYKYIAVTINTEKAYQMAIEKFKKEYPRLAAQYEFHNAVISKEKAEED